MDELDLTDAKKKAAYQEIKDYVLEHSGLKVALLPKSKMNCISACGQNDTDSILNNIIV